MEGVIRKGDGILFMATQKEYDAEEVGFLKLKRESVDEIRAGDVGYVIGSVKSLQDAKGGDSITHQNNAAKKAITGYKEEKPPGFSGIVPSFSDDFTILV